MLNTFEDLKKAVERLLEETGRRQAATSDQPPVRDRAVGTEGAAGAASEQSSENRQEAAEFIRQAIRRLKSL